jgi:hypothetical protein
MKNLFFDLEILEAEYIYQYSEIIAFEGIFKLNGKIHAGKFKLSENIDNYLIDFRSELKLYFKKQKIEREFYKNHLPF